MIIKQKKYKKYTMNKILMIFSAVFFLCQAATAQVVYGTDESDYVLSGPQTIPVRHGNEAAPLVLAKNRLFFSPSSFKDNWFLSVKGGFVSFLNTPNTPTDFNGRTKGLVNISFGKWHTPFIGNRFTFQGLSFIDYMKKTQNYQNYHLDFLLNVSSFFRKDFTSLYKWNLSPYVGFGAVNNSSLNKTSFGVSYGMVLSYNILHRVNLSFELGNTVTARNFDGFGNKGSFGDNLLSGAIGLTFNIGSTGWKHKEIKEFQANNNQDGVHHPEVINIYTARNNYSGLNSLHERLGKTSKDSTAASQSEEFIGSTMFGTPLNAPILFFFKKGTKKLINSNQLINIQEIAGYVMATNQYIQIIGSADSQTGSVKTNRRLSAERAQYIAKKFREAGVPKERINGLMQGGVNMYKPVSANRHTCVIIYKKDN